MPSVLSTSTAQSLSQVPTEYTAGIPLSSSDSARGRVDNSPSAACCNTQEEPGNAPDPTGPGLGSQRRHLVPHRLPQLCGLAVVGPVLPAVAPGSCLGFGRIAGRLRHSNDGVRGFVDDDEVPLEASVEDECAAALR